MHDTAFLCSGIGLKTSRLPQVRQVDIALLTLLLLPAQPMHASAVASALSAVPALASSPVESALPPPDVSVARGWFDAAFTVELTSSVPGASIRFTTDGQEPAENQGTVYSSPLRIDTTTVLRAGAFKLNSLPSPVATHTYLFADQVLRQRNDPAGFPVGPIAWGGYPSDYEMDPEAVTNWLASGTMKQALLALPALSIVCRNDDMFGAANGIYTHPTSRGPAWERPCSVEWISADGSGQFQAEAGIQVQGNASREPQKQPKHPFRLVFKGAYGPRELHFRVFPDSPIAAFDTLVLRADFNYSWLHWDAHQRTRAQRSRDAWLKDSMRAMGGLVTHNRYVHLFINGLYWGVYDPSERPDGAFAAAYLGGNKEDYDVMNEGEVVDGGRESYDAMLAISALGTPAAYAKLQRSLDLEQFIDYMLLHFYAGHLDWGRDKNWYAFRPKDGTRGFFYLPWDSESILNELSDNRVSNSDTPSGLHTRLIANPEYRLAFADRVHKHLFNRGALTPDAVQARWTARARELELPILAESARWGDYRRDVHPFQNGPFELYTRDNQWRTEQKRLLTEYFPKRTAVLLGQLRAAGLYPQVAAPEFEASDGSGQPGVAVRLQVAEGTAYFTRDGSDPRLPWTGTIAPSAAAYSGPIPVGESVRIRTRSLREAIWSALAEADFTAAETDRPMRFTEVMFHPIGGEAFEFVELENAGGLPIELGGYSLSGIEYVFPHRTVLDAGQVVVLASDASPDLFAARYPKVAPAGYFRGALSNSGEQIALLDRDGRPVTAVTYDDGGLWPAAADGQGFSLDLVDLTGDPNSPDSWRASSALFGSPGTSDLGPSAIRLRSVFRADTGVSIEFEAMPDRTYTILSAPSFGAWRKLADVPAQPARRVERVLVDPRRDAVQFYRLVTPAQP